MTSMRMRSAAEVLALIDDPFAARRVEGNFLCFVMIPVVDRFGQWRFAGAARHFAQAFEKLEALLEALLGDACQQPSLREFVESPEHVWRTSVEESWSAGGIEDRGLGEVTFEVLAEGDAPYDHSGLAIVSVSSLDGHPYQGRAMESRRPVAWSGGDFEADLDRSPDEWLE